MVDDWKHQSHKLSKISAARSEMKLETYSPFASSSQISKNTMKSYLQWHGPTWGRVRAVSLVAGTEWNKSLERVIKITQQKMRAGRTPTVGKNTMCPKVEGVRKEERKAGMRKRGTFQYFTLKASVMPFEPNDLIKLYYFCDIKLNRLLLILIKF